MDWYSVLLLIAATAAVAGGILGVLARVDRRWGTGEGGHAQRVALLQRTGWYSGLIAVVLVMTSALTLFLIDHQPGSDTALRPLAFMSEHPAMVVFLALGIFGLAISRGARS
jgi:hypothetical protein